MPNHTTTWMDGCAMCSALFEMETRDAMSSQSSSSRSMNSSIPPSTPTPAWKPPTTPPEGSLTLNWNFATYQTARAWADLMRDMLPVATHLWSERPQWAVRWSVSGVSHNKGHEVFVTLWCEPARE